MSSKWVYKLVGDVFMSFEIEQIKEVIELLLCSLVVVQEILTVELKEDVFTVVRSLTFVINNFLKIMLFL